MTTFNAAATIKLEVDTSTPRNLLRNPSGELGYATWATGQSNAAVPLSGSAVSIAENGYVWQFPGTVAYLRTCPFGVAEGQYVGFTATLIRTGTTRTLYADVLFYDSQMNGLGSASTMGSVVVTTGAMNDYTFTPVLVPAGAVQAEIDLRADDGSGVIYASKMMVRTGGTGAAATGVYVPAAWTNVAGSLTRINTTQGVELAGVQDELQPGSLSATVVSATLDPAFSTTLRRGRPLRLRYDNGVTKRNLWQGTVESADTLYDDSNPNNIRAVTSLTGTDSARNILDASAPYTIASAASTISGADASENFQRQVGFSAAFAGLTPHNAATGKGGYGVVGGIVGCYDESAKAADWIRRARNTHGGAVWVDSADLVKFYLPADVPTAAAYTLSDTTADVGALFYTAIGLNYGARSTVNALDVTKFHVSEVDAAGKYGPYTVQDSVNQYDRLSAVLEILQDSPSVKAGNKLAVYSVPKIFPTEISFDTPRDIAQTTMLAPYTPVRVKRSTLFDATVIVMRVSHEITARPGTPGGATWKTTITTRPVETAATVVVSVPAAGPDTGPVENYVGGFPYAPGLLASRTRSGTFGVSNNLFTTVPLNGAVTLDGITWDGALNRYTVPKDGRYTLAGAIRWVANATGVRGLGFGVNGVQIGLVTVPASATASGASMTKTVKLAAGDVVTMSAYQNSGGSLNIEGVGGGTFLDLAYIGP